MRRLNGVVALLHLKSKNDKKILESFEDSLVPWMEVGSMNTERKDTKLKMGLFFSDVPINKPLCFLSIQNCIK